MPGVSISFDVSGAINSLNDFQAVLDKTGASSKLTGDELDKLKTRFENKLAADKVQGDLDAAAKNIEKLGKAAGLSEGELARLHNQMGSSQARQKLIEDMKNASSATDSFSKVSSMAAEAAKVMGVAFGAVEIARFVKDAAEMTARYDTMGVVMKVVGNNAGYTGQQMEQYAQAVQRAGISMVESRESLTKMAAAQLDLTKSAEMARVAQDAAVIAGINSSEAFGRMTQGIQTGQAILLHHLGIMVNFEEAYQKTAQSLGVASNALTDNEKAIARQNAVLEYGHNIAGTYEAAMGTAGKQLTSFTRYVQDFETVFGRVFQESLTMVLKESSTTLKEMTASMEEMGDAGGHAVAGLVGVFLNLAGALKDIAGWVWKIGEAPIIDAYTQLGGGKNYIDQDKYNHTSSLDERKAMALEARRQELRDNRNAFISTGANTGQPKEIQDVLDEMVRIGKQNESKDIAGVQARSAKYLSDTLDHGTYKEQWNSKVGAYEATVRQAKQDIEKAEHYGNQDEVRQQQNVIDRAKEVLAADIKSLNSKFDPDKGQGGAGPDIAKIDEETQKWLGHLQGVALAEQEALTGGTKYAKEMADATRAHDDALADLNLKMRDFEGSSKDAVTLAAKYWLDYAFGIKKAKVELDGWNGGMDFWAKTLSELGALSHNPALSYAGGLTALQKQDADARLAAGDDPQKLAALNALNAAKQRDLYQKTYGDDARKAQLEDGLKHATSADDYVNKRMALDTGSYLSPQGKAIEGWKEMFDQIEGLFKTWENDLKTGGTELLDDVFSGKGAKKIEADFKDMLARMRKEFLSWTVGLAEDWGKRQLFSLGTGGSENQPKESLQALKNFGLAGSQDNVSAMAPAIRSYNLLGLVGGQVGAQQLISDFTPASSLNEGASAGYSSFIGGIGAPSVGASAFGVGMPGISMDTSAPSIPLTDDQQSMVMGLVASGTPYNQAVQLVTGMSNGGSTSMASGGAPTATSGGGSSGSLLNTVLKYGGYAKDAYNALNGLGSSAFTNVQAGDSLIQTAAGQTVSVPANDVASTLSLNEGSSFVGPTPASSSGLMGIAGPALAAGGIGYMAGGYFEPQGSGASIAGGLGGALAGGLAASEAVGSAVGLSGSIGASLGASLGIGAGLAATGVGAIVALGAAALTAALSPSVTTTSPNGNNGVQILAVGAPGTVNPLVGYEGFTNVTTGSFGQSSTSHYTMPTPPDPATAAAWRQSMGQQTTGLTNSMYSLGMGQDSLSGFLMPTTFNVTAQNASQMATNVANAMAMQAMQASNLMTAFNAALEPGETYIAEINRIGTAYGATTVAAQAAGTSLATLSGSADQVGQGDWASQAGQLMGSNQTVAQALQLYATSALSKPQQLTNTLGADASMANTAIGLVGQPGLNTQNFWQQYGQALQGPMSDTQLQAWANASQWVSQLGAGEQQAISLQQTYNNLQISALREQIQSVQNVKVMMDGLNVSIQSAESTYQSLANTILSTQQGIQWNSALSPNTPTQTYQQQKAYWNQLNNTVQGEGPDSVSYSADIQKLTAFAQTFLQTSKAYYGNSAQYQSDYNSVQGVLGALQTPIDQQLATLKSQLQAQDQIVNAAQKQIDALSLSNQQLQIVSGSINLLGQDTVTGFNNLTEQMAGISGVVSSLMNAYDMVAGILGLGFAEGGDHYGGFRVVGERGWELEATGAARYFSHDQARDILSPRLTYLNPSTRPGLDASHLHRVSQQGNRIAAAGFQALIESHREMRAELADMRRQSQLAAAKRAR